MAAQLPAHAHTLVTLSKNSPPSLQHHLAALLRSRHIHLLGCLVDPLRSPDLLTLSAASFVPSASQHVHLLHTTASSYPPPALGREIWSTRHSRNDASEDQLMQHLGTVDKAEWFSPLQAPTTSNASDTHILPDGTICQARFTFSLSRRYPERLVRELHELCPNAHKLGLIAASTVFERNGESSVLFNEHGVYSADSLTLAVYEKQTSFSRPSVSIVGLNPLGEPLRVISARGNIISSLSSTIKNATKTLKQLVDMDRSRGDKQVKYFLGVQKKESHPSSSGETLRPNDCDYIARITSGSTSRGTVAISSIDNVREGDLVQFYRQDRDIKHDLTAEKEPKKPKIQLVTTLSDGNIALGGQSEPDIQQDEVEVIKNVFYGTSGYGFFLGPSGQMGMTYEDEGCIGEIELE